jgi:hypothetical protein
MIVSINLTEDGRAPITVKLGVIDPQALVGEPSITFRYDGATYGLDEIREYLSGLEDTRRKYQEIMTALGR